eukprot:2204519-Prymnesium_polylepis.1
MECSDCLLVARSVSMKSPAPTRCHTDCAHQAHERAPQARRRQAAAPGERAGWGVEERSAARIQ